MISSPVPVGSLVSLQEVYRIRARCPYYVYLGSYRADDRWHEIEIVSLLGVSGLSSWDLSESMFNMMFSRVEVEERSSL